MKTDWATVFLLGPPAAGKTTIGHALAARRNAKFRTIDEWTPRGESMSDAQVDGAMSKLFSVASATNEIVELCYHDYVGLLASTRYPLFLAAGKVVVTAPLAVCKARNALRLSPVREAYVERAWLSTEGLIGQCTLAARGRLLVVNTSDRSIEEGIEVVSQFLDAEDGRP